MSDRRRRNAPVLSNRRDLAADRRSAPRYATRGTAASIGWDEGTERRSTAAGLIDISMGGFAAWVDEFPPAGAPVWLRLEGDHPSPWLRAVVIARTKSGCLFWTRRQVRLRFAEACTYDFFKAAIDGFTRESTVLAQPSHESEGGVWR